jgi:hypothetical protein
MAIERTLSIIKPDATRRNLTGKINAKFEEAGLRIVAQKRIKLTMEQAGKFYEVHKERPFYGELCEFMASEPVVVQVSNWSADRSGGAARRIPQRAAPLLWQCKCASAVSAGAFFLRDDHWRRPPLFCERQPIPGKPGPHLLRLRNAPPELTYVHLQITLAPNYVLTKRNLKHGGYHRHLAR